MLPLCTSHRSCGSKSTCSTAGMFGCICNTCHKNSSGWWDSTAYLLSLWYSSSLARSMNIALVETCTWKLMKTSCSLLRGNPVHEEAHRSNAKWAGWLRWRRSFCLLFGLFFWCVFFKERKLLPVFVWDTYFPKPGDQELWFLLWLSCHCCSDSVTDLPACRKASPFATIMSKQGGWN